MHRFFISVFLLIIIIISCANEKKQKDEPDNEIINTEKEGVYEGYKYTYQIKDSKVVVLFADKFLPNNDEIVVGVIRQVIEDVYNEKVNSKPFTERRNGVGLILLEKDNIDYCTMIVKEDTGEVHSFVLWKETK